MADIRMRYEGATELKIEDGALVAVTPYGNITEDAPYSYMQDGGAVVASKYILEGNELRFDIGSYSGTLVIDPELKWGTYYDDPRSQCAGMATDTAGFAYLSGATTTSNIATTGAYQVTLTGAGDIYIVKFDHDGKTRKWCTYFGGTGHELTAGIAADKTNGIYIAGATNSTDSIAGSSGVYQAQYPGKKVGSGNGSGGKGFLARFDTDGKKVWSTYYGDSMRSYFSFISADSAGNVYGIGVCETDAVHAHQYGTSGAFIVNNPGGTVNYFMAKFNRNGQRV